MSIAPTEKEMSRAKGWFQAAFSAGVEGSSALPLSFKFAGAESASILGGWKREKCAGARGNGFVRETITYTDPVTGLECRCEVKLFTDFPAVEWVGYFKNTGDKDTPIISDIQALDAVFPNSSGKDSYGYYRDSRVYYSRGSDSRANDFEPQEVLLRYNENLELQSTNGRSSDGAGGGSLPFFNVACEQSGIIGAIGWTGGWHASFDRKGCEDGEVAIRAGMNKTHLVLHPGEEIRTPRILLQFWEGDRARAHNIFRRLTLAHYTPTLNGEPALAPICDAVWGENTCGQQLLKARWWKENDVPLDMFWIDAGWHGDAEFLENSTVFNSGWPTQVGNWWPNKTTYPDGLKPIGDELKNMGYGFVLWLEPERAFKETQFTKEHPEWLLGPQGDNWLFNLGIPEAREYLTDLVSSLISEAGITCYRQDFNMPISPFWEAADAPDRVGISEIKHIEGLYAFWDGLRERHPGLLIDNCSSGGRRIDLETNSRSIPLWRSDFQCIPNYSPTAMQGQTHGLAPWVPLSTGNADRPDDYSFRSGFGPGIVITTNIYDREPNKSADWHRKMLLEQRVVEKYFYGDFYPLLAYSLTDDVWAMWQYDRPDLSEGLVLAFRRQESPFTHAQVCLKELEPDAQYTVKSIEGEQVANGSGRELMENGFEITISSKPGSAVLIYSR